MRRSPQGLFVWRENLPAKYYLCTWNLPSHLYTHINDNLRPCCLLGLVDGSCQVLRNIDTLWRLNHQRWFYQVVWLGPRRICWEQDWLTVHQFNLKVRFWLPIRLIWKSDTDCQSVGRRQFALRSGCNSTSNLSFPTHLPSKTLLGFIWQIMVDYMHSLLDYDRIYQCLDWF